MAIRIYRKPTLSFTLPKTPAIFDLQPGVYHRVLSNEENRSFAADGFNPYLGYKIDKMGRLLDPDKKVVAGTRFAPIKNNSGDIISTLYLAATDRAAYAEILVRAKSHKQITLGNISRLERVTIETTKKLSLLNIIPPFIDDSKDNVFGMTEAELVQSPERYYPETCRFAAEVHQKYPKIQGLHWFSRQQQNNSVVVLFGDRTPKNTFNVKSNFDALSLSELRVWLPDAARYGAKIDDDLLEYLRQNLPDFDQYRGWYS